ncbi:hypothetical protein GIB67_029921 [Kingdonia uniflora]|uniref:Uncharacterized protein n=1 Tax=Kingdonia uniflora TaxID=39325 RepID=A0A7J7MXQ2_9MAGN|nr:hypothetical protein GIB67_029921 [Kingdonia uniflora]
MNAEKNLRGVLRSEVDRSLSKENIVIVDSLNSIKGYRYELWCLARAVGIRYCVVIMTCYRGFLSVSLDAELYKTLKIEVSEVEITPKGKKG